MNEIGQHRPSRFNCCTYSYQYLVTNPALCVVCVWKKRPHHQKDTYTCERSGYRTLHRRQAVRACLLPIESPERAPYSPLLPLPTGSEKRSVAAVVPTNQARNRPTEQGPGPQYFRKESRKASFLSPPLTTVIFSCSPPPPPSHVLVWDPLKHLSTFFSLPFRLPKDWRNVCPVTFAGERDTR